MRLFERSLRDAALATAVQRSDLERMGIDEFLAWDSDDDLRLKSLSPSNSAREMAHKRDDYACVGIRQVLEVGQSMAEARLYRRDGERWIAEMIQGLDAVIALGSIGIFIPMAEIYEDVELVRPRNGIPPDTAAAVWAGPSPADSSGP